MCVQIYLIFHMNIKLVLVFYLPPMHLVCFPDLIRCLQANIFLILFLSPSFSQTSDILYYVTVPGVLHRLKRLSNSFHIICRSTGSNLVGRAPCQRPAEHRDAQGSNSDLLLWLAKRKCTVLYVHHNHREKTTLADSRQ